MGLENEAISVTFHFTRDELMKAHRQYLVVRKIIKKYDNVLIAIFLVLSVALVLMTSLNILRIIPLGFVLIFAALKYIWYFWYPEYRVKQSGSDFLDEVSMTFLLDGIMMGGSKLESKAQWSYFTEIYEGDDYYFLVRGKHDYYGIPKSAFADLEEMQVFREMASANSLNIKF